MYPFLVPCFVMGIATPDQLITNVDYQNLPFSYKKAYHREYYTNLSRNVHQFYLMQMVVFSPLNNRFILRVFSLKNQC